MYDHKGGYPAPWWAQARDLEHLQGRERAEATWGKGYYQDDAPSPFEGEGRAGRVDALERAINRLYALSAIRSAEVAELAQRRYKPRY